MSAGIFDSRMAIRGKLPWHNFVKHVWAADDRVTPERGVVLAGCDYEFKRVPMHIVLGGKRITVDDKVALVRMPHGDLDGEGSGHKIVSVVHKNYPYYDNLELAKMLNPISDRMPLESVAALEDGNQIFFCFNAGEAYVKGLDPIAQYITMSEFRDGVRAFEMFNTDVRTVCANTYSAGIDGAAGRISIGHAHGTFKGDAEYWTGVVSRLRQAQKDRLSHYDRMASELVPDDEYIDDLLETIYPVKPKPKKVAMADAIAENRIGTDDELDIEEILERVKKDRERWEYDNKLVLARRLDVKGPSYETTNDQLPPALRGTKWAVFNAVTQYENYRDGRGSELAEIGKAVMFGSRAAVMQKAYKFLDDDAYADKLRGSGRN